MIFGFLKKFVVEGGQFEDTVDGDRDMKLEETAEIGAPIYTIYLYAHFIIELFYVWCDLLVF